MFCERIHARGRQGAQPREQWNTRFAKAINHCSSLVFVSTWEAQIMNTTHVRTVELQAAFRICNLHIRLNTSKRIRICEKAIQRQPRESRKCLPTPGGGMMSRMNWACDLDILRISNENENKSRIILLFSLNWHPSLVEASIVKWPWREGFADCQPDCARIANLIAGSGLEVACAR